MKSGRTIPVALLVFLFVCGTGVLSADALREAWAITFLPGATEKVQLRSTDRLPDASGESRVERKGGTTVIEVEVDSMKPASLFGGDYNTYVFWAVPPGGQPENLGEIRLEGDRGSARVSTASSTFALLVTAEPHYLVTKPSAFVVLENKPDSQSRSVRYPVIEGVYNFQRSSLADVKKAKGEVHTEVRQAFTAVRLAERAGSAGLAPGELAEAQHSLDQTLDLWRHRVDRIEIAAQARETVRLALAAQRLAEDRAFRGARVEAEGSGGGNGESGGRNPRGKN